MGTICMACSTRSAMCTAPSMASAMHHGVAIVSRVPFAEGLRHDWQDAGEARHVGTWLEAARGEVDEPVLLLEGA